MSDFHPLEVVGRARKTQLQEGDNFNYLIYRAIIQSPVGVGGVLLFLFLYCGKCLINHC